MIALENAGMRFGPRWIFRHLDLAIPRGCCLALLGPNGRGKTTLIKAALGTIRLTEGTRAAPPVVGYVPQAGGPLVPYRVLDMVVMGKAKSLGVFGSPASADYDAAHQALADVGLTRFAEADYTTLSGGERQLVLLARALATGADTIVLDEPASALDLANQDRFLTILSRLARSGRFAILFSTHLPQHALHVASEALLMLGDGDIIRGETDPILSETNLERLYGIPVRRIDLGDNAERTQTAVPIFGGLAP